MNLKRIILEGTKEENKALTVKQILHLKCRANNNTGEKQADATQCSIRTSVKLRLHSVFFQNPRIAVSCFSSASMPIFHTILPRKQIQRRSYLRYLKSLVLFWNTVGLKKCFAYLNRRAKSACLFAYCALRIPISTAFAAVNAIRS